MNPAEWLFWGHGTPAPDLFRLQLQSGEYRSAMEQYGNDDAGMYDHRYYLRLRHGYQQQCHVQRSDSWRSQCHR